MHHFELDDFGLSLNWKKIHTFLPKVGEEKIGEKTLMI
jgi:hypothetical protein